MLALARCNRNSGEWSCKCPKKGFSISTLIHGPQRWQFPVFPALQKTSPNIVCYVEKPHHRHKDTRGNLAREPLRTQGKAGLYILNTRSHLNTNAWQREAPKPAYFVIRKHSLQVICLLLDSQNKRQAVSLHYLFLNSCK